MMGLICQHSTEDFSSLSPSLHRASCSWVILITKGSNNLGHPLYDKMPDKGLTSKIFSRTMFGDYLAFLEVNLDLVASGEYKKNARR
jgi:hypothetical protein